MNRLDLADDLVEIKRALGEDTAGIKERADIIRERGDCLSLRSLAVGGADMALIGISGKKVGETLDFLLEAVLDSPSLNKRDILIELACDSQIKKM